MSITYLCMSGHVVAILCVYTRLLLECVWLCLCVDACVYLYACTCARKPVRVSVARRLSPGIAVPLQCVCMVVDSVDGNV